MTWLSSNGCLVTRTVRLCIYVHMYNVHVGLVANHRRCNALSDGVSAVRRIVGYLSARRSGVAGVPDGLSDGVPLCVRWEFARV